MELHGIYCWTFLLGVLICSKRWPIRNLVKCIDDAELLSEPLGKLTASHPLPFEIYADDPASLLPRSTGAFVVSANKCYKDEDIGDREGNVYYCNDPGKPECCEEESAFTCCEEQAKKSLKEQLILWGSVGGVVVLISLVCCYFWRDGDCCKGDTTLREKCCSCCRKSSVDEKAKLSVVPEAGTSSGRGKQPWYIKSQYGEDNNANSPVPEFKFKSLSYDRR